MSKKSKKNLQKILAKRQQLQQIKSSPPTELLPSNTPVASSLPAEPAPAAYLPTYAHSRELIRTAISLALITVLLVGVIIFDQQRDDLKHFGNWLYQALRLNQ